MGQGTSVASDNSSRELSRTEENDSLVQVAINNVLYTVTKDIRVETSLNTYIRDVVGLKGTKVMCREGGCGTCIVTVEINGNVIAVNSCLVPVIICDGWKITTIEGIGNRKTGYHTIQTALAEMNGSQCGYCSPGWVMSMYSLIKNGKITMKETENSFAGNLCRCTGYRPILDAFKSLASDASPAMRSKIRDIEELYNVKSCKSCLNKTCIGTCKDIEMVYESSIPREINMVLKDSTKFYKVLDVKSIFKIFETNPDETHIINGGNTAHGVYRLPKQQIYIDVNSVDDLHRIDKKDNSLTLGANVTLSVAKTTFEKYARDPGFEYLKTMAEHIDLVASVPVRNIGTLAGNLMIKNQHPEFPSDIFLILETAGAEIHILSSPSLKSNMNLIQFLTFKMYNHVIYSIVLPALSKEYVYKTYKIMPRAQNAHAMVNAGFLFKLDSGGKVLQRPNIIFGGIKPDFFHASKTELFLQGKSIYDVKTLKEALKILQAELNPDYVLPDYKPEFRKRLATGLLYKFVLSLNPDKVSSKLRSGGTLLQRELSSGKQDYDTDRNIWPVNKPISKIGAIYQTSGEGEYINDIPIRDDEVFCAVTLAQYTGAFESIDYDEALSIDGVIAFYSAKDIPGRNTFVRLGKFLLMDYEEIALADKEISFSGQAYGIIAAKTHDIAQRAASKVRLVYLKGPRQKPMVTIHDVLASNNKERIVKITDWPASKPPGSSIAHNIKGSYECGSQYHFTMETQTCLCVPIEDGMDVFSATQYMDFVQASIAELLDLPIHNFNLRVRRLGGAYGAKLTRANHAACLCALVCHKLNRPARLAMTIEDNMRMIGKRVPALFNYDLSVDEAGKIQKLDVTYWGNKGNSLNETHAQLALAHFYSCYDKSTWSAVGHDVVTDLPANTWCRAPGSTEGVAAIENIMERIARETGKDPLEVRIINMDEEDKGNLQPMIDDLKKTSEYEIRLKAIEKFNQENRWKKRGISLVPMKYPFGIYGQYHSLVSIYARDGTVSITTAGIEMGQGLHTKIAQVAAYTLGIDLSMVSVKPSISLTSPNSWVTGGSLGSDVCGYATLLACNELINRLEPTKKRLGGNPSWRELVLQANVVDNVDLCASASYKVQDDVKSYSIYGATVSEVEVDMLTGQILVRRVDVLEDTGISLSPLVDIGQIEGSLIMGIGYWTIEDLIYDSETGGLTNFRTWNYKIPGAKDIPIDFRVSFRRNAPNPFGIVRSKATGEPPFCMSCSVPIAIRYALNSARADAGNTDTWYQLDNALTMEKILLNSLTEIETMVL